MEAKTIGRPKSDQAVPDCFRRFAAIEGDLRLRARYNVGRSVILRWRAETNTYCGAPRGPKRMASRATPSRPAPYRSHRKVRYNPAAMDEISWYDGAEDVDSFLATTGIHAGYGE